MGLLKLIATVSATFMASLALAATPSSTPPPDATPATLNSASVTDTFRQNLPTLQRCYLIASQKNKAIKVRVEVSFEIAPDGHVITSKVVKSDHEDGLFDSCLIDAVRSWTFAAPAGGTSVKVTYPLLFEPGNISVENQAPAKKKRVRHHSSD